MDLTKCFIYYTEEDRLKKFFRFWEMKKLIKDLPLTIKPPIPLYLDVDMGIIYIEPLYINGESNEIKYIRGYDLSKGKLDEETGLKQLRGRDFGKVTFSGYDSEKYGDGDIEGKAIFRMGYKNHIISLRLKPFIQIKKTQSGLEKKVIALSKI